MPSSRATANHEFHRYEGAGHAFLNFTKTPTATVPRQAKERGKRCSRSSAPSEEVTRTSSEYNAGRASDEMEETNMPLVKLAAGPAARVAPSLRAASPSPSARPSRWPRHPSSLPQPRGVAPRP